jgi:hypothetical protein
MGAEPYWYFFEYKPDIDGALLAKGTLIATNLR